MEYVCWPAGRCFGVLPRKLARRRSATCDCRCERCAAPAAAASSRSPSRGMTGQARVLPATTLRRSDVAGDWCHSRRSGVEAISPWRAGRSGDGCVRCRPSRSNVTCSVAWDTHTTMVVSDASVPQAFEVFSAAVAGYSACRALQPSSVPRTQHSGSERRCSSLRRRWHTKIQVKASNIEKFVSAERVASAGLSAGCLLANALHAVGHHGPLSCKRELVPRRQS
jgi:hypothetical protein